MLKMKVLGCTGGIGSGKSYVANIFSRMGIPVYDSDCRAKSLYDTDTLLRDQIVSLLGASVIKDGVIQRPVMASLIFKDKDLLWEVEKLVHPAVVRDFCRWKESFVEGTEGKGVPFVIMESAILLEKPLVKECTDMVLNVSAPLELRIGRVMARDGVGRDRVLERMDAQWDDEMRQKMSDFTIFADGKMALLPQVRCVYEAMCRL